MTIWTAHEPGPGRRGRPRTIAALGVFTLVAGLVGLVPNGADAAGSTYYVAQGVGCSDASAGTTATAPLCTIWAATKKATTAGDTISVGAGDYHEQVGLALGVTVRTTVGATITGTDDLSGATWTNAGTSTSWVTTLPAGAAPSGVTAHGTALANAGTGGLTTNSYSYASSTKRLSVDLGAATAPAAADALVARRSYGIKLMSNDVVDGFTIQGVTIAGAYVAAATGATVQNIRVSGSRSYGVFVSGGTGNTVTGVTSSGNSSIGILLRDTTNSSVLSSTTTGNNNHGVSVQGGSGNRVARVTSFNNTSTGGPRVANGIDVNKSAAGPSVGAVVQQNTTYGNADSGIEIYSGSSGATVRRNVSYNNGDHGIDISNAPNARVVSNTVVSNATPGINVEGGSTGVSVRNNIAADNAIGSSGTHGDIRVDAASTGSATLDYDLVFRSSGTGTVIEWATVDYTSLAAFRAAQPTQETHGRLGDPKFTSGYSLGDGSPALDSADASVTGWLAADRMGSSPFDQTSVPDTGAGTPPYADRGALERTTSTIPPPPADTAPNATLTVTPAQPKVGEQVTLDASGSTDDHGITGYAFACGNGFTVPSGTAKRTTCTYPTAGNFTASVTVTDSAGHQATATKALTVTVPMTTTPPPPPPNSPPPNSPPPNSPPPVPRTTSPAGSPAHAVLTVNHHTTRQMAPVVLNASTSTASTGARIVGYTFSCGTGDQHAMSTRSTRKCMYRKAGEYVASVVLTDSAGQSSRATTRIRVLKAARPRAHLVLSRHRVAPSQAVMATSRSTGSASLPITRVRFSCGAHHRTVRGGQATMRCSFRRPGWHTVRLTVWNGLGLWSTQTQRVWVRRHR